MFSLLKEGGAFARFANRPQISRDIPELAREIDGLYGAYYNRFYGIESGAKPQFTEDKARQIAQIPAPCHVFFRGFRNKAFNLLEDSREKAILEAYYIGQKSMNEIADRMNYSLQHTYRLKRDGVEKMRKMRKAYMV